MTLNNYIEIRNNQQILKWCKKEAIEYEYKILLDCCELNENNTKDLVNNIEPFEIYPSRYTDGLKFTRTYLLNQTMPTYFIMNDYSKELYIGKFVDNPDDLDQNSFYYTIYEKFIEFNKVEELNDDFLYKDLYGITIDSTHKRLYYFINKIGGSLKSKYLSQLPENLRKEYNKIFN